MLVSLLFELPETAIPAWLITVFVTIVLFMILHLGGAIWFASRMNTQVAAAIDTIKQLCVDVKAIAVTDARLAVLDQRVLGIEERLREARDKIRAIDHG